MSTLDQLKRRKIVQWGLAYLAGAWVVLQLVEILAGQFGWSAGVQQGGTILLAFGFFIALVVAWYHGEKGRQRVSGPEILMVAGILVVAGAAIAFVRDGAGNGTGDGAAAVRPVGAAAEVPERSIAVLPLDDHSAGDEHAYFAGAMTEEITSALSKVPELKVTSRSSASKFGESGLTVREFALEELGVAHVLEGSVQRVANEARITVQLIDARTDEHLWSHTYQRELVDVLDVQVEIARQVADRLASSFTEQVQTRIVRGMSADPVAYDMYLRGLEAENDSAAIAWYRQSVQRDSTFPMAWAQLGMAYLFGTMAQGAPWEDSARIAMARAIELAEDPAYRSMLDAGKAALLDGEPGETLDRLREAVEANPGQEVLARTLGQIYGVEGELGESVRYVLRSTALDPLDPRGHTILADHYRDLGLYDEAEEAIRRAHEVDPEWRYAWESLIEIRQLQGRYVDALAAVDSLARYGPAQTRRAQTHLWAGNIAEAHSAFEAAIQGRSLDELTIAFPTVEAAYTRRLVGDSAGARRMLEAAESTLGTLVGTVFPDADDYRKLQIAAVRGDADEATRALKTYVEHGGTLAHRIQRSPLFADVREHPEFEAELDRLSDRIDRMRRQVERILERGS